jgi:PPM family protein phosphatase
LNHFSINQTLTTNSSTPYLVKAVGKTDKGNLRPNNEDNFAIFTIPCQFGEQQNEIISLLPPQGCVLLVADGLGGAKAGEVASQIATESIFHQFQGLTLLPQDEEEIESLLKNIIFHAHEEIVGNADAHKQLKGMGTTVVLAWLLENQIHIAWCGDSRCYLIGAQGEVNLLTDDHSKVWELVRQGLIAPEQARTHPQAHIITQALGDKKLPPKPSFKSITIHQNESILLCSDGLTSMLSDSAIAQILANEQESIDHKVSSLMSAANHAGGIDNITVVLATVNS